MPALFHGLTVLNLAVPATGGLVAGSILAPAIVRRVAPPFVLAGGLLLAALGVAVLTQLDGSAALTLVTAGSLVMGLGAGAVGTLATDAVVAAAPPERAGAASAISETGAEIGGALGIAVLGSIGAAVYRRRLSFRPAFRPAPPTLPGTRWAAPSRPPNRCRDP